MGHELLKMENILKVYPNGIIANKGVNFSLKEGEIHALVGENGSGKSTLMKILFGLEHPEEGKITLRGETIDITSPHKAIEYGIGMVHQHFMLVSSLTVAQNIFLGIEPRKNVFMDTNTAIEKTLELSKKYNLHVDPRAKVEDLSVGTKQKVEILKALLRGAKILILDEPTAVLTPQETQELFVELVNLKKRGHTLIFISHKLDEIKQITDRITVMRNGKSLGVYNTEDVTQEEISRLMVGKDVKFGKKDKSNPKEVILNVSDVSYTNSLGKQILNHISFSVRKREILGIAGIEGNGQSELIESIVGLRKIQKGDIFFEGRKITNCDIKQVRDMKISYIPEDRMLFGVAEDAGVAENLISDKYFTKCFNKNLLMDLNKIRRNAEKLIKDYEIKCDSPYQEVRMLSGGNIQKVVVARELSSNPRLLIADQPTRGIDIGAANFIHQKLIEMRDKGSAIILVSAAINEVLKVSDNLLILNQGEIVSYIDNPLKITEEELGLYMLGLKKQSPDEVGRAIHA